MSACRSCAADVTWAHHHQTGAFMPFDTPVDYVGDDDGLWTLCQHGGTLTAWPRAAVFQIIAAKYDLGEAATHERLAAECVWRRSHFASCPQAATWRRRDRDRALDRERAR